MKKFFLPLLAYVLIAPVFAQQGAQPAVLPDNNSQMEKAPQASAESASAPEATTQTAPAQDVTAFDATPLDATPQAAEAQAVPAPATHSADDKVIEEIVARVNNAIITRADLRRNLEQIAFDTRDQNLTQAQIEERQGNALRDLIDQQLLMQKAAELGISADADLVKRLDEIRKQMKAGSLEELQKIAEGQGVRWEEFKKNTRNSILTQKVIGSEVGARIQITREEAQKYYDDHKSEFSQPERVRLSEILIANDPSDPKGSTVEATPEQTAAAEAKIQELHAQLRSGASFDELARKESNGPTAVQGGDLGYFKRNDLAKTLEEQTFKLKAGEYTPPIHTRQGFIILLVSDHIEAGTPTFERVREQIHERLYVERVKPALREYLVKLRDEAYIDVKPGYTDTGASASKSSLVYATDSGPRTKQVRGKLGLGKTKTVVVSGEEKADESQPTGAAAAPGSSTLGRAKAEAEAREKAAEEHKSAESAAAAKAAAEAAEAEKLSHMSNNEKNIYLAQKKKREEKEAKNEAKRKAKDELKQKELAEKEALRRAEEAKAAQDEKAAAEKKVAKNKKQGKNEESEKKESEAASAKSGEETEGSQQAESEQQPQKKKIHWF